MSAERLLIVGASARAAAFSAMRAGFQPLCADRFADVDLSRAFKSITDKAAQTEAMIQELSEKVQAQYDLLQSGGKA